jgi:hypothetical protein
MRKNIILMVIVTMVVAAGCAPLHMQANFSHMGEANPTLDQTINDQYEEVRDQPTQGASEVKVLVDALPEGLSFNDGVIANQDGFGHQILGKFSIGPDHGAFPEYRQGWRKGVCYWQQPLVWVSLTLWMMVPTYYPCFTTGLNPKQTIIDEVKRLAQVAGGDLAVISYFGVSMDAREARGAAGFILKIDPQMKDKEIKTHRTPLNTKAI